MAVRLPDSGFPVAVESSHPPVRHIMDFSRVHVSTRLAYPVRRLSMRMIIAIPLLLAFSVTFAGAGEIYGTVKEGGKPVKAGTKVEVKCPKGSYATETDKLGSYRLFLPEEGKCTLAVRSGDAAPQMTVHSFEDSARYNLVLEKKDGKPALRTE
jgi:hypothetical protein